MGQGLARAEAATSAATSCFLRRRRRAIGAIVVCGPFLGCLLDECGQRSAPDLLPAIEMSRETGAEFWVWTSQASRAKIPKDVREAICQTRSPGIARGRLGMRTSRRSVLPSVSLLGERNAVAATHIDHSKLSELGSKRV